MGDPAQGLSGFGDGHSGPAVRAAGGGVMTGADDHRSVDAPSEEERRLRQIIDAVPALLWATGLDGKLTHVSQRLLDYSGVGLEQFKQRSREEFVHPDDLVETLRAYNYAIQTGTSYHGVARQRRADGEFRWHDIRCEPLIGLQGRVVHWYGATVDIDERKKAEDALRRSEAYLAEAQQMSHTGSAASDDTRVLYWSDETYRIFGFDPLDGLPDYEAVLQRVHPDDRAQVLEARQAARQRTHHKFEYRIVPPGGAVKYIEQTARPKFAANGDFVEIVSTLVDVTERKRSEQALRDSEARFRDYAETASDWFAETDVGYKFTMLSANAFGSGAAERIGTTCWDHALDLETEPEKWRLLRQTLIAREPIRDFVYLAASSDGSPMYVRASGKPLFDASGEFRGYRGAFTNVTEMMRAQEALRESERSLRSAIDGIAGLVAIMAPSGETETVNRQCLEYFGQSLDWLRNWQTNDAIHPEDLPRVKEMFAQAMAGGVPYHIHNRLRRFDGEYRWFDSRAVPVRDDFGRILRWYFLITDVEDHTRALAQLDQMQADFAHMNRVSTMGELAASLAHEIAQPIAAARNNARAAMHFLDRSATEPGPARDALGAIVEDADRAARILDRIRDHTRNAPPRKEAFDLNEAIEEVTTVVARNEIARNGVTVETRCAGAVCPVWADRVQLQQVVLNLVLNAVHALSSVSAGTRELSINIEPDQVQGIVVTFRDTGPGIHPEDIDRIFQPFYTTKSNGVGMGLAICRSIIEAHGGRLWAEANEPGGAVFRFSLLSGDAKSR